MSDTAQDFRQPTRTPLGRAYGVDPSRRDYEEPNVYKDPLAAKRQLLKEAKAEFDRQADELQENLEKLSRHLSRREP